MSGEPTPTPEKLLKKYPFLAKNWLWIFLALLILAGLFVSAYEIWHLIRGKKETKKE